MKKSNILISLLAISCLTACGGGGNGGSTSQGGGGQEDEYKLVIEDFGTVKFEAEDFDVTYWEADESYDDVIVENANASGGKYLAAASVNQGAEASFKFELKKYSRVVISAAYAQMEGHTSTAIDMSKTYDYNIENVSPLAFETGKNMLPARSSATSWELMPYEAQPLYPGVYSVVLTLNTNATDAPSIDYLQFKTTDATIVPPDPSKITEDDIPDNEFHNLQQYKYLLDENWETFATYATGGDFSAPRGMKLRFEDVDTASKYYVQVAESEAGLNSAAVRETTENKFYTFQNAKLSTKYYYRAATSEADLASAKVYNITSTDLAPRVVNVPNVLNFRDIGGWESELVPGAKINQGLYFRCAQLNQSGYSSTRSELDSEGKGLAAIKELGIKVDIDMRDSNNIPRNGSPANTADWPVSLLDAHVASGTEPERWEGTSGIGAQYKKIFDTIANCDKAPVALHCTYGADRTGIATFFLEGLLGMKLDDIRRDYVWTKFTQGRDPNPNGELAKWIQKTQDNYTDATFADKIESHLMSKEFGIAKSTLEHIREIFVPGYVAKA